MAHRTALLIDASRGIDGDFQERVNRLLQSVNGDNIKVDLYTFDGHTVVEGRPGALSPRPTLTLDQARASVESRGNYVQVLLSQPGPAASQVAESSYGSERSRSYAD